MFVTDYTKSIESLNTLATALTPSLSADDAVLIAKKYVSGLMTLETQNSDGLDFHTVAVWSIEDMHNDAYKKRLSCRNQASC